MPIECRFPPHEVHNRLAQHIYASVVDRIPALHLICQVNALLFVWLLRHSGASWLALLWMGPFILLSLVRLVVWVRRGQQPPVAAAIARRRLAVSERVAMAGLVSMTLFGLLMLANDNPEVRLVSTLLIALGWLAVCHCISAMTRTCTRIVLIGIVPLALGMILTGDFVLRCLSFPMLAISALMIASFRSNYRLMQQSIRLQMQLDEQARCDPLTGLNNRRALIDDFGAMARGPTALLLIDVDHFKAINDRHGHAGGDAALTDLAALIRREAGAAAMVSRLGGEEFAVLLPERRRHSVYQRAEHLRLAVAAHRVDHDGGTLSLTVSIGIHLLDRGEDWDSAYAAADRALYQAKLNGRNACHSSSGKPALVSLAG